jgi:hypothetical protein
MVCLSYRSDFETGRNFCVAQAHRLLGQVIYPRFPRALFGMDQLAESFDREALAPDFDLKPIRKSVADFIQSLQKH